MVMDVTNKESIIAGRTVIEQNDGKLHVLVNKLVVYMFRIPVTDMLMSPQVQGLVDLSPLGSTILLHHSTRTLRHWGVHCSTVRRITTGVASSASTHLLYTS